MYWLIFYLYNFPTRNQKLTDRTFKFNLDLVDVLMSIFFNFQVVSIIIGKTETKYVEKMDYYLQQQFPNFYDHSTLRKKFNDANIAIIFWA